LHQAGDQFVMLDISATPFATLAPEGLNAERVYRPVTFGQSPADVANVPYTYQGENLRPRAPAGVIAGNTGNDLTLAIVGRTRYPTSFWTSGLEPQNEPVVRYEVDVLNGPTVLRTLTDVGGVVTYTEADQITDWGSAVTTADAVVYQMSDRVGRGHPLYTSFNYTTITYALFDPAQKYSSMVLSGDNSTVSEAGGAWRSAYLDTTKTTGKWYYEFLCGGVSGVHGVGVSRTGSEVYSSWCGSTVDGWMYFGSDGGIWHNNTKLRTVGTTYATGDVIGVALDADTGDIWFSKNGTWITGDPSTGTDPAATITGGDYRPGVSAYNGGSMTVRSAPGETAYPAPLGFNDGLIK
jgi:hypothetical protein